MLAYLAQGMWRLREPARKFGIGFFTYDVLTMFLTVGIPSTWKVIGQGLEIPPGYDPETIVLLVRALFVLMGILDLFVVWVLITRKGAFVRS